MQCDGQAAMDSRKKDTYFECFNIHRIDLVYAQAKGHNEQQGFPDWARAEVPLLCLQAVRDSGGLSPATSAAPAGRTQHIFSRNGRQDIWMSRDYLALGPFQR